MKHKLSFYITIKGITMRLKNTSLRTISHVAEQLADLENADELKILVTSATQRCDYQSVDERVFLSIVKKAAEYNSNHKNDLLPIDLIITAILNDFPDVYITRNSNAIITVQNQSNPKKKYRVFAGLLNGIVLHVEPSNSQPVNIKFDTIDELLRHLHATEYFGL